MRISLQQTISKLKQGEVVAVPTETVYGLAAPLSNLEAIEQVFALKGRPSSNPLIIHVSDVEQILRHVTQVPPAFDQLAQACWPGPLTMILPIHSSLVPSKVRAGLETAGFRIPHHPLTLQLLKETGPLVMPSANLSGFPSATRPAHVEEDFGQAFPVLDGGASKRGVESTIIAYLKEEWVILRLGSLSPDFFQPVLGYCPRVIHKLTEDKPLCPGQLFRHYAPNAKLILGKQEKKEENQETGEAGEALGDVSFILGFQERTYPKGKRVLAMGSLFDPQGVAENLYHILRQLDQEKAVVAWVDMDFPREGLWLTIAERLERAAVDQDRHDDRRQ